MVLVNAQDFITTAYFPSTWRDATRPVPRATLTLSLAPFAHALLDVFGAARTLWGSDWPVSELAGGFEPWWRATWSSRGTST